MKQSIKVAVIGTRGYPSYYGGFETALRHLVDDSRDMSLKYLIFSRKNHCAEYFSNEKAEVIFTPYLESKNLGTLSHIFLSLPQLIWQRPDAILAFNVSCGFILPMTKLFRIPVVLNVDGMEWKRAKWGKLGKAVFWCGAWLTARFADVLIADSTNIARNWKDDFKRTSFFIPYGGVPTEYNEGKKEIGRENYLLFVARFVPENHFPEFLKSLEFLDPSIPVKIVGSSHGNSSYDLQIQAAKSLRSNIQFLGVIRDEQVLNSLWEQSSVYFHGHSVGGTNPALVQAMASGSSIVAFDSVYNREVLGDCGVYSNSNPRDIANTIESLFFSQNHRKLLSDKARNRAAQEYSWSKVIQEYEAVLHQILKTKAQKSVGRHKEDQRYQ